MSYAYTTAALIQAELQSSTAFSTGTLPTLAQVTEWIAEESGNADWLVDACHAHGLAVGPGEVQAYDALFSALPAPSSTRARVPSRATSSGIQSSRMARSVRV